MSSVLQPWVEQIPWKQQSILFSGLRGPDTAHCPAIKEVVRWLRKISQRDADPSQSYMAPGERDECVRCGLHRMSHPNGEACPQGFLAGTPPTLPAPDALKKELEFSSCHYVHHFASALRVVALHHPDEQVKTYAHELHFYIADELFHFVPESDAVFLHRHRDRVEHS